MFIKDLFRKYHERYYISPEDLADYGETNRNHLYIASLLLSIFGLLNIAALLIIHHQNLLQYIISIGYFGIFLIVGISMFFYCKKVKNVAREKAYNLKTVPSYVLFYTAQFSAVYNFYILKQPFNGFVICCLTGFVSLCIISMSPIAFMIGNTITIGIMAPGIYNYFGVSGLADSVLTDILLFCLALYKRLAEKKYLAMLNIQKNCLEAKTFGNFTLLYDNKVIKFTRTKSNELVGYLIYKNGSSVNTKELISVLWGDYADSARYGNNLRNLIVDIKHSLNERRIQNFFIAEYNNFRINPDVVKCDYYDFLSGDADAMNNFAGEFMSQYSWAEDVAGFLEKKVIHQA